MAVTKSYPANETTVYSYLTSTMGLNIAAACGVLANIQAESNFNHQAIGDNGTSYGLCQWHNTRWTSLKDYCADNGLNSTTIKGQLRYLEYELNTAYYRHILEKLKSVPDTSAGAYDAAWYWCYHFEVPANKETKSPERGRLARGIYWSHYSNNSTKRTPAVNKGDLIVTEAKKHLNKPYKANTEGPNQFDQSGFIHYVYRIAINYEWNRLSTYSMYKSRGKEVSTMSAGDLVFFVDTKPLMNKPNISHVGIATGNGDEFIHCSENLGKVAITKLSESEYYKSKYYCTKRILADAETSSKGTNSTDEASTSSTMNSTGASGGVVLTYQDAYDREIEEALEYINEQNLTQEESGLSKYGYLLDTVHGDEFKFYVPEYDTNTTANWEDVAIMGRSVSIKGYMNTSSKSVTVNLSLMAGVGLYADPSIGDRVKKLHDDVAFVESLAYPDYSKSIVLPPPKVLLYLGPTLQLKGVVGNVSVKYLKPYDTDLRPMRVELSFEVTHVTDSPPDYRDIRNHKMEGSSTGRLMIVGQNNSVESRQNPSGYPMRGRLYTLE